MHTVVMDGEMIWVPNQLRQAGRQLLCLADRLKCDPPSKPDVINRVVAELTTVAAKMQRTVENELIAKADEYQQTPDNATPDNIRALGHAMIRVGDHQYQLDHDLAQDWG